MMDAITSQPKTGGQASGEGTDPAASKPKFSAAAGWGQVRVNVAQQGIQGKKNFQQLTRSSVLGVLRAQKVHSKEQLQGSGLIRRNSNRLRATRQVISAGSSFQGKPIMELSPASSSPSSPGFNGAVRKAESGDVLLDVDPNDRGESLNPRIMAPPGLEVLTNKTMLVIRQQMEMDVAGACGSPNTYKIWDSSDQQLFFGHEESSCCCRWMCGPNRKFSLELFSTEDELVVSFHRSSCRCDCCCCLDCFLCLQKLYVVDSYGRTLGTIKQKFSFLKGSFEILDHDENLLYKIQGPCCPCRCCTEINFQIMNKTGEHVIGRIFKKWGGDRMDFVNVDHEYFEVTFPAQIDDVDKALIIGGAFLVNYMYLEMS